MRGIAECKNHNPITSIEGLTPLHIFAIISLSGAFSKSVESNLIKLETLIESC